MRTFDMSSDVVRRLDTQSQYRHCSSRIRKWQKLFQICMGNTSSDGKKEEEKIAF